METKDTTSYKKFTVVTKAELSKYNEGFETFFETFNKTFSNDGNRVQWEQPGYTLRFLGNDRNKLKGAMSDFGFGGYVENIEILPATTGTPSDTTSSI